MNYAVIFSPEAEEQLSALYRYIASAASRNVAARHVEAIVSYCESLSTFPLRGARLSSSHEPLAFIFRCRGLVAQKQLSAPPSAKITHGGGHPLANGLSPCYIAPRAVR